MSVTLWKSQQTKRWNKIEMKKSVLTSTTDTIYSFLYSYLSNTYKQNEIISIVNEINTFSKSPIVMNQNENYITYEDLEEKLSKINEKQSNRKEKGVYYTDNDITEFIVNECMNHYELSNRPACIQTQRFNR